MKGVVKKWILISSQLLFTLLSFGSGFKVQGSRGGFAAFLRRWYSRIAAFPTRGRLCVGDTAFLIQPPPLRGTSFHRKEGASTRAPSLGRGCRAQRGGVGFLFCGEAASSLPSPRGEGAAKGRIGHRRQESVRGNAHQAGDLRQQPSACFCKWRCPKMAFKSPATRGS